MKPHGESDPSRQANSVSVLNWSLPLAITAVETLDRNRVEVRTLRHVAAAEDNSADVQALVVLEIACAVIAILTYA
jgi:hypothetical protein